MQFNSEEIWACEEAGITVTLPKPMTSNAKTEGRFGKQDLAKLHRPHVWGRGPPVDRRADRQ